MIVFRGVLVQFCSCLRLRPKYLEIILGCLAFPIRVVDVHWLTVARRVNY